MTFGELRQCQKIAKKKGFGEQAARLECLNDYLRTVVSSSALWFFSQLALGWFHGMWLFRGGVAGTGKRTLGRATAELALTPSQFKSAEFFWPVAKREKFSEIIMHLEIL